MCTSTVYQNLLLKNIPTTAITRNFAGAHTTPSRPKFRMCPSKPSPPKWPSRFSHSTDFFRIFAFDCFCRTPGPCSNPPPPPTPGQPHSYRTCPSTMTNSRRQGCTRRQKLATNAVLALTKCRIPDTSKSICSLFLDYSSTTTDLDSLPVSAHAAITADATSSVAFAASAANSSSISSAVATAFTGLQQRD